MSVFLIYFETGKPVSPSSLTAPLVSMPVAVRFIGSQGAERRGFAITDGLASDYFLRYGNKVADRKGLELRKTFFDYLKQRLALGAHPYFTFQICHANLELINVNPNSKIEIVFADLERCFHEIQVDQLIELKA